MKLSDFCRDWNSIFVHICHWQMLFLHRQSNDFRNCRKFSKNISFFFGQRNPKIQQFQRFFCLIWGFLFSWLVSKTSEFSNGEPKNPLIDEWIRGKLIEAEILSISFLSKWTLKAFAFQSTVLYSKIYLLAASSASTYVPKHSPNSRIFDMAVFKCDPVAAHLRGLRPAPTSKKDTLMLVEKLKD